ARNGGPHGSESAARMVGIRTIVCIAGRTALKHGNPSTSRMIHLESLVRETRTPGSESRGRRRLMGA
ncbi:MAG: hypothetical protein OXD43_01740, partial [Bacteroidetes bacterium]|nr:hypothetical protein [Bacteroidota bacterium]